MKIARFEHEGTAALGIVEAGAVQRLKPEAELLELLGADALARDEMVAAAATGERLDLGEARLLAPIEPRSLRDFMTFEVHVEGVRRIHAGPEATPLPEWYEAPTFYFSNTAAVKGPSDPVPIPPGCEELDFELEVAAIVGGEGADLAPEQAEPLIVGYTILNDWSARDLQLREMRVGLGPAKGKDFANTLGPWIVSSDELEPHRRDGRLDLRLEAQVNGEPIGKDSLANMGWSFAEMVAYASRGTRVLPGDVLGSGTSGGGCLAELWGRKGSQSPPPLRAGDEVTITVDGIGSISNEVVPGVAPVELPPARPPLRETSYPMAGEG